jgi:membrane-bound lytic murein transglycosylase D
MGLRTRFRLGREPDSSYILRIVMRRSPMLAVLVAIVAGVGVRAAEPDPEVLFPCSDAMREGVEFWKHVYSQWSLSQVVLHDLDHPSIVYEIFELPPPTGEVYTDEQRDYVKNRREALQQRLAAIEAEAEAGTPLADDEKALVLKITEVAGGDGLIGASLRVRSQRGMRERFRRGLEISGRYHDAFVAIFREAGLPLDLAELPHVESSYQVAARSSAGAVGVWQFTRGAARKFMLMTPGLDERFDPVASARGAARYLKTAYDELGSWPLAITSYNHGIEGMKAASERFGLDFPRILDEYDGRTFGFASKNFYKEFLAAREIVKDPATYFPEGLVPESPLRHDSVLIEHPTTAAVVATRYKVKFQELVAINPAWTRRALSGRSPLPPGTQIWLPNGTLDRVASLAKKPKATAKSVLPSP